MTLEEIKAKLNEAGIEGGVIDAVAALDVSADVARLNGELTAEKGKNAGILADKKRYKGERDTLKTAADEVKRKGMSDEERGKADKEAHEKALADLRAEKEQLQTSYAKEKREAQLANIAAGLKAADNIDSSTISTIVKARLADVEDLTDETKITEIIGSLKESNKSLFAATVPTGSGSHHDSSGGSGDDKQPTTSSAVAGAWS